MNKIFGAMAATATLIAGTAQAVPASNFTLSAEYAQFDAKPDFGETIKLKGFALTAMPNPVYSGLFGKLDILSDDEFDMDYWELSGGYQHNLVNQGNLYALATIGLGYAQVESSYLDEDINFLSIPVGFEAGYTFIPQASIFAGLGYKWLIDSASEDEGGSVCRDGWHSKSIGKQGACSHHGGVAYTQSSDDSSNSADGVTYKVGLRYNF